MKCKINRNAAKVINKLAQEEENKGKMLRIFISQSHGNHAHYGLTFDTPTEFDEIVKTDKEIDVLLDTREEMLDGVFIQYFYVPKEGFTVTNSSKGNHGDH